MSHDIIKSISFKKGRVFVTAACSNIYPKNYVQCECPSLTKILVEDGRKQLDAVIFKEFRNGNFQGISTLYAKALNWQREQQEQGLSIDDGDLLARFKNAWDAKVPVSVFYDGAGLVHVGSKRFTYSYNHNIGKQYQNITRAKFALRGFSIYKDKFQFRVVDELLSA